MNQQEWLERFLSKLAKHGWQDVFSRHGWNMSANTVFEPTNINRTVHGFEELSIEANCPIEPGDPARSLLYHALMSPGVISKRVAYWPKLDDIDKLENLIYGSQDIDLQRAMSLFPVVMAYEYRPTSLTPHQKHADIVFSRTGVGRVGTHEPEYDGKRRCFNTSVVGENGLRVQAVRYAVFLCKKVIGVGENSKPNSEDGLFLQGGLKSGDDKRVFWKPITKLFDGCKLSGEYLSIKFEHYHQNKKLKMMVEAGGLEVSDDFNLELPPFYYSSNRDNFISFRQYPGSIEIWRNPQAILSMAKQNNKLITFKVPKENLIGFYNFIGRFIKVPFRFNNRRYTSLRVGQSFIWALIDYGLNALLKAFRLQRRVFLSSRLAGEYTNIRHALNSTGEIVDLNLLPRERFKKELSKGGYQAVMYEDPISEGFVSANISWPVGAFNKVKPAYSLMTAPDFMPRVGNIEIYRYANNFVTGGPRALCEGRLAVNLGLRHPKTGDQVFFSTENTITSIVSLPRLEAHQAGNDASNSAILNMTYYLTDSASDVFAPGWDVTYARDSLFSSPYYHTAGLGSPFLEDVKLCAAANGMWPAASPDAARTFKRKTRTALPLTDQELGLSPNSVLAAVSQTTSGWDGEYGPFLKISNGAIVADYASIERSDYIANYEQEKIDFSKLRKLNKTEVLRRMATLASANEKLLNGKSIHKSEFWLVSFVIISNWSKLTPFLNMPSEIIEAANLLTKFQKPDESGYLLIFADYSNRSITGTNPKRREQPVDNLYFVKSVNSNSIEPKYIEALHWKTQNL